MEPSKAGADVRLLATLVTMIWAAPLSAATMSPWPGGDEVTPQFLNSFSSLLHAWTVAYRDVPGDGPASFLLLTMKLAGLVLVSFWMAAGLPRARRTRALRAYVSLAARAMSRMR